MKRFLAELMGTFFLTLAINIPGDPLTIGLMFMAMIYLTSPVSGAHLNPIVTFALWLRNRFSAANIPWYWLAQILGACLVSGFTYLVSGKILPAKLLSAPVSAWVLFAFEFLFSFVLVSVILMMVTTRRYVDNPLGALVIGLTLTALAAYAGAYNPAVSLAWMIPNAVQYAVSGGTAGAIPGVWELLVFLLAPFLGSLAAALKFNWVHGDRL
jgi:aquaporin Z